MQIFRSDVSTTCKTFPRTEQILDPSSGDHPILYLVGLSITRKNDQLCLGFDIPYALNRYTSVYVDLKNLSTNESIPISQKREQKIILNPDQQYLLVFNCDSIAIVGTSSYRYVYEFNPAPQPV